MKDYINPDWGTRRGLRRRRHKRRYRVKHSDGQRYPFNMHVLVREEKISVEQRDKFMNMLCSTDPSMEMLAISMLRKLGGYE